MSWESMSFEQRQAAWTGSPRQFRQHHGRGERPTVWEIRVDGARVHTRFGLLGGAMQETDYVGKAKNVGKANALTPEQDALREARRDARKKWDFEGYDEYVGDQNIDRRHEDVTVHHLLTALPSSFCLYKPENNLEDQKKLLLKARDGKAWYTLKRDGMAKWIVVDYYGNVRIYSRRTRPWNDKEAPKELDDGTLGPATEWAVRFPHIVEAVKQLRLPPSTMLAGELIMDRGGRDDFRHVASVTKSLTAESLAKQAAEGYPSFYWWDIPFYEGQDLVSTMPVRERFDLLHRYHRAGDEQARQWIQPIVTSGFPSPEDAALWAKNAKVEGWVVVDPDGVYGDKGWNLKGKPDRPGAFCAKLKPRSEDDFVAYWDPDNGQGEWGTGKHEAGKTVKLPDGSQAVHGGVGALALYQYNEKGELVFISKCSSGMDYSFQAKLRKDSFPLVCQVEYVERTYVSDGEKTNALRHPTFVRLRDDKQPGECVNARL